MKRRKKNHPKREKNSNDFHIILIGTIGFCAFIFFNFKIWPIIGKLWFTEAHIDDAISWILGISSSLVSNIMIKTYGRMKTIVIFWALLAFIPFIFNIFYTKITTIIKYIKWKAF